MAAMISPRGDGHLLGVVPAGDLPNVRQEYLWSSLTGKLYRRSFQLYLLKERREIILRQSNELFPVFSQLTPFVSVAFSDRPPLIPL